MSAYAGSGRRKIDRSVNLKRSDDTVFAKYTGTIVDPAELSDDFFTAPAEAAKTGGSTETSIALEPESQPSKQYVEKIELLESEIKLLRAQNAQLLVNSAVLYNTLVQHIEELRAALHERDTTTAKLKL